LDGFYAGVDKRIKGRFGPRFAIAFNPLRDDPRFHDLLLRMNLQP